MSRTILAALAFLLLATPAFGQTTPNDSQTLQALLAEVRQLRNDLHTSTLTAQRAQILIYRMQAQEAVVERLSQRFDDTKTRLAQLDAEQKHLAGEIKQMENVKDAAETPTDRKQFEDAISRTKERLNEAASEVQESQAKATDLEVQLRTEQAKLGRLQDDLDRLDKALEDSARQPSKQQ